MLKTCLTLFIAMLLLGCGGKEEVLYEGLPLKIWVERLQSPDEADRKDALNVIKSIGKPASAAEKRVRGVARNDPYTDVKMLAIETLKAMKASTVEFHSFVEQYDMPIRELMRDNGEDEDKIDEVEEAIQDEFATFDLEEKASGDDDLSFLQEMEAEALDTIGKYRKVADRDEEESVVPSDPDEFDKWSNNRFQGEVQQLMSQISNPRVLASLLANGGSADKLFAATKLSQMRGVDEEIVKMLEAAQSDPDSLIRSLVNKALNNWEMP